MYSYDHLLMKYTIGYTMLGTEFMTRSDAVFEGITK
jgi:hypothetical protein